MKKGERYVVSPWAMIYTDDNYYLLAYTEGKFKHFRVDRMDKAEAMITEIAEVEVASLAREGADEGGEFIFYVPKFGNTLFCVKIKYVMRDIAIPLQEK